MKLFNYLLPIFLIQLLSTVTVNGQTGDYKIVESSFSTARMNYYLCYGDYLLENQLCGPGKYLCELVEGLNNTYTIVGIDFSHPNTPIDYPIRQWCYVENLGPFPNLTSIFVGSSNGRMRACGASFLEIGNLTKLKKLTIRYTDEFDSKTILPESLEEVYLDTVTADPYATLFEGKLKTLHINNLTKSLPTLTNQNSNLLELKIGMMNGDAFSSVASTSFSENLISLTDLKLNYYNSTVTSAPSISSYTKLENLEIISETVTQSYEFPTNPMFLSNLKTLTLSGGLFTFNNGINLSGSKDGFEMYVSGYSTSFSTCSTCIKFPVGSKLDIQDNFEFDSIDFKNIYYFKSELNKIEQQLPELLDISNNYNFKSFIITNSDIYGTVPDSYCQLPFEFSLINNQLSDFPLCFKCDLNIRSKIIPNPLYMPLSTNYCTSFNLSQVNNVVSTIGGELQFMGTSLGWEYTMDSKVYSMDISNSKFTITIPKGVGSSLNKEITFNGGQAIPISYNYKAPVISTVEIIEINGVPVLIVYGTDFNYEAANTATIENYINSIDKETITANFERLNESVSYVTSIISNVVCQLEKGKKYYIYFTIGGQQSNTIEYDFNQDITTCSTTNSSSDISSNSSIDNNSSSSDSKINSSSSNSTVTSSSDLEEEVPSISNILTIMFTLNITLLLLVLLF